MDAQSLFEGQPFSLNLTATDPDLPANKLTFSLLPGAPTGMRIDPASGQITWTPTELDGSRNFSVAARVSDNRTPSKTQNQTISFGVAEQNSAPHLTPVSPQSITEGSNLQLIISATDPDRPANTLRYQLDSGAPVGMAVDSVTGLLTWTPTETDGPGTYTITVRVIDNGAPAMDDLISFDVTADEHNTAPVLETLTNRTVSEDEPVEFSVSATDLDWPANRL